ncbi:hypothetical protein GIB67_037691 [Kingdonia uniflora]|uniref:Myb-like domain-containing protein n=1 Tax=Kingdonia uniflora TaxID=39325 RepID=A0A7J7MGJ8_9MAGN|nr:hypothetical protein GIB67_037691 [Kingdonia uniflora]
MSISFSRAEVRILIAIDVVAVGISVGVSMRALKQKWASDEEEALKAVIKIHGVGKWKTIQTDPECNHCLVARFNIDLQDMAKYESRSSG